MDIKTAERIIKALAEDSGSVIFSNHALERMDERDISDLDVLRTLRRGYLYENPQQGKKATEWKCKMVWPAGTGRDIGVVTIIMDRKKLFIKNRRMGGLGMSAKADYQLKPYQYTLCGLKDIFLLNGFQFENTEHGEGVSIEDGDGLHRVIGKRLIRYEGHLNGREFRFLRKEMEMTQAALAHLMGSTEQTVANWEKGKSEMPGPADRMIRGLYSDYLGEAANIPDLWRSVANMDDKNDDDFPHRFKHADGGWGIAA